MSQITTNRISLDFSVDNIKRDFAIIRFAFSTEKQKWWGAPVLDRLMDDDIDAVSVAYCWGNYAYAMFSRTDLNVYDLINTFRSNPDFSDVTAVEVEPVARFCSDETKISGLFLARLLLNSLAASKSRYKEYQYSNLTGSLLMVPPFEEKFRNQIGVAKAELNLSGDPGTFLLKVSVNSFRKIIGVWAELKSATGKRKEELSRALDRPRYAYHEGRSCLRRCLKSDGTDSDAGRTYIQCGITKKRIHTNFLHFWSIKDFEQSRAGILNQLVESVQRELAPYMTMVFATRSYNTTMELSHTLMKDDATIRDMMDGHRLHVVDRVGNEQSSKLAEVMRKAFSAFVNDKEVLSSGVEDSPNALNFRIVHDASFYEKEGLQDEYRPSSDDIQRQNLTLEATGLAVPKAMVKTLVKEQLIKFDIANKQLSIFDWSAIQATDKWVFGTVEKDEPIRLMAVDPDGAFEFKTIIPDEILDCGEFQKYIDALDAQDFGKLRRTKGLVLEGFVGTADGNINLIFRSDEICLPDLQMVKRLIQQVEDPLPEEFSTGSRLSALVSTFMDESGIECERLQSFSSILLELDDTVVKKNDFRKMLNEHVGIPTKSAKAFRKYLYDVHRIRLSFPKQRESMESLFDANLNIKYFEGPVDEAYYFVGERRNDVQFSFKNACHLRKIVAVNGSKLILDQLLPAMNVDFVRTGQSTVVPFPFKYIREYVNLTKESAPD